MNIQRFRDFIDSKLEKNCGKEEKLLEKINIHEN